LGIDIGAFTDEQHHHLFVPDGEHGQVERRIAVLHVLLIHALYAQQRDRIGQLVTGTEHPPHVAGSKRPVVVLDVHIGAGVEKRLRDGNFAMKGSHMQRRIALRVYVRHQFGVALEQGLHLVEVAFARRFMNRAAESEAGAGKGRCHEGGETGNSGKGRWAKKWKRFHCSSEPFSLSDSGGKKQTRSV
jgi:hypothetical protein